MVRKKPQKIDCGCGTSFYPDKVNLGERLKHLRHARGLTQFEVGEKTKRDQAWISRVESGDYESISLVNANLFSKFYDVSFDYILSGKEK